MVSDLSLRGVRELYVKGVIGEVVRCVGSGKESDIYLALSPSGERIALKVYRVYESFFRKKSCVRYMRGDHRFKSFRRSSSGIIRVWCRKEYRNLVRAFKAGVRVPRPIAFCENVLAMEFIGEDYPAPSLAKWQGSASDYETLLDSVIENIRIMYRRARLVHGDLSEYNILVWEGEPYIIDWGSAVTASAPNAGALLERDVTRVLTFFSKYVSVPPVEEVIEYILR